MAGNNMPTDLITDLKRTLDVDPRGRIQSTKIGRIQGFLNNIKVGCVIIVLRHSKTGAVDRYGGAKL
jgi:hypothetical protein